MVPASPGCCPPCLVPAVGAGRTVWGVLWRGGCGAQWGMGHVVSQGAEPSCLARQPRLLIQERARGQPNPEEPGESPGRADAGHEAGAQQEGWQGHE